MKKKKQTASAGNRRINFAVSGLFGNRGVQPQVSILLLLLLLILPAAARADYYNPQHWLIGSLEAGTAPSADNHCVNSYYPPTADACATCTSGPAGLSGQPGRYMVNAFDIPGRTYAPGLAISAEVRGTYTAGPVGLTGSAAGYDLVPPMTLQTAVNLTIIAIRESGVNLRNGDYIADDPRFSLKPQDPAVRPLVSRSLIELKDADSHGVVRAVERPELADEYRFSDRVPPGNYDLTATIWDGRGSSGTKTIEDLKVSNEKRAIDVLTDKTVWRPSRGELLTVAYTLTRNLDVDIQGISISGEQLQPVHAPAGTMGGRAGYNHVELEGKMAGGGIPGNGIYILQFSADRGRTFLTKTKIVVGD